MDSIIETIFQKLKKYRNEAIIILAAVFILDIGLCAYIYKLETEKGLLRIYFLDVGQGDSELIVFPGGAKILIDSGPPNKKVLQSLSQVFSPFDKSIDLAILTHPHIDHFGGFSEILKRFKLTGFISNGLKSETAAYGYLKGLIQDKALKDIELFQGDKIRYRENIIEILSPAKSIQNSTIKDLNDTSLVLKLISPNINVLFMGDAGVKIENNILQFVTSTIALLKIGHHGSKYSTSKQFLKSIRPKLAVLEVGKNSYNLPAEVILKRLENEQIKTYRTDKDGTIKVEIDGKNMKIFKFGKVGLEY